MAVTGVRECFDDIFNDDGDMREVDEIMWKKLKEARLKEGFADGKCLGEESTLQSGFNHGYYMGFELSYPISVIQGLLCVVEMQFTTSQSKLLKRSRDIKIMLDKFKENVANFKLNSLHTIKSDLDDDLDFGDENRNNCMSKTIMKERKTCYFASYNGSNISDESSDTRKCMIDEFTTLKDMISHFVSECNQPLILDQISRSEFYFDSCILITIHFWGSI